MRIISGELKGRLLPTIPKGFKARPTTDFAKENLFNILENLVDFENLDVLDLFGGTGGISYEFASRGCISVDIVEIEPLHFAYIKKAAETLGFKQIQAIKNDSFKYIKFCNKTYDIIFADPPYTNSKIETIPQLVFENNLLKQNGYLVLEHSASNNFSKSEHFVNSRHYGSVCFSFFKN